MFLENLCDNIDAAVFTGDVLQSAVNRKAFKEYLGRWTREVALIEETKCNICGKELNVKDKPRSEDCGGDCLECMAITGEDPDCIEKLKAIEENE